MNRQREVAAARKRARAKGVITTIIVAITAIFAVFLLVLRLAGFEIYTVMSGSMAPKYRVGSLIYVRKTDAKNLKEGDIVTFMMDKDTIVTHRIYAIDTYDGQGYGASFITKGDANGTADAKPVRIENVLGQPVFSIPLLGYAAYFIQRPPGIYIALVAGTLLIASVFLPSITKRKGALARDSL